MKKIASFTINHLKLLAGIYVSRKDYIKDDVVLTTFDLRFTMPNREPVMDMAAVHAIEHLGATYLRNDPEWMDRVVYFGPMGCRTGFYAIFVGDLKSEDVVDVIRKMTQFIIDFEGDIPGAAPKDCGNYHDSDLPMAKYYAKKYMREVLDNPVPERLNYPE